MKEILNKIGGLISAAALIAFTVFLMAKDVKLNITTWILWTTLDVLIATSSRAALLKEGRNEWPWLPIGWAVGAGTVTCILFTRGAWQWTSVETLTAVLVALATIVWKVSNPKIGVVALTIAMAAAGIPSIRQAWSNPDPASWWLWAAVCVSCGFTIVGAKKWSIEDRFLPVSSLLFNGTMTFLVLR